MSEQFDLIVLGSGSGARDGANKAAKEHDARVALIENTRWGGSCPNVACKPTKAYLVAAELAHDIETLAEPLGICLPHMGRGRQSRRGAGPGFAGVKGGYDRRFAPTPAIRR